MPDFSRAPAPSFVTLPRQADPPARVVDFLEGRFPSVGRAAWESRIARGLVSLDDGGAVTVETAYREGARVRYFREVASEPAAPGGERVLYRDERLLVADKPHGLPVTPGGPYVNECLLYRLRRRTGIAGLQAVHRLDRDTAGLVLFALTDDARGHYGRLFMEGRIEREYRAVARVAREPEERSREVENRIARGEPWFRMKVEEGEANARTRIELLRRRGGLGLFRLVPRTGKKHQLRLHMAGLGFPIVGDRYYPELEPEAPPDPSRPLLLVATALGFLDPLTGRERRFHSEISIPFASRSVPTER